MQREWEASVLAGNLVHVRNHQKQALGGGEGGGKSTGLEGAVDGTGGTGLRLHLLDGDSLAPEVLAAASGPLVHVLSHGR